MAIKRFNDYNETKAYGGSQELPNNGYVLKIMKAEVCENSNGQYVKFSCDIAEGEYKDYYANEYRAQQKEDKKWHCIYLLNVPKDDGTERDGWAKRKFKTVIEAIEDSNPGYHFDWDENKFKGKLVGGLFNVKQQMINGTVVTFKNNIDRLIPAEIIRNRKFQLPPDKLLDEPVCGGVAPANNGFVNIPDGIDDELPFN